MSTTFFSLRRLPAALFLAGTLAVSGMASAQAQQEISPEHLAAARSYIDLTDNANVYEITLIEIGLNVMRILVQQDPALADPVQEAIQTAFDEYEARKSELYNQFARIYAMRFTQEELEEILTFYNSDLGKKLLAQNVTINQDMRTVLGVWEQNTQREFLARVRAILREGGYNV
ncbi:DUF2059 domain-containing protein [Pelagibacterium limicola]|uniref:DUF2059 domain-containing protein n=1 Tax=Pelagibacterium limicola TaxID=2791022 RepID=UPI0018AFCD3F|nr:DUF2059 domain-containing protein [Pelagibacterium limicola]